LLIKKIEIKFLKSLEIAIFELFMDKFLKRKPISKQMLLAQENR